MQLLPGGIIYPQRPKPQASVEKGLDPFLVTFLQNNIMYNIVFSIATIVF